MSVTSSSSESRTAGRAKVADTARTPRTDIRTPGWTLTEKARLGPKRCCARCRRGSAAYGELPCGYLGQCPNGCHTASEEGGR